MSKLLHGHYRELGGGTIEEISLRSFTKNSQWLRVRDVLRQSSTQPRMRRLESFIAFGMSWWREQNGDADGPHHHHHHHHKHFNVV